MNDWMHSGDQIHEPIDHDFYTRQQQHMGPPNTHEEDNITAASIEHRQGIKSLQFPVRSMDHKRAPGGNVQQGRNMQI